MGYPGDFYMQVPASEWSEIKSRVAALEARIAALEARTVYIPYIPYPVYPPAPGQPWSPSPQPPYWYGGTSNADKVGDK